MRQQGLSLLFAKHHCKQKKGLGSGVQSWKEQDQDGLTNWQWVWVSRYGICFKGLQWYSSSRYSCSDLTSPPDIRQQGLSVSSTSEVDPDHTNTRYSLPLFRTLSRQPDVLYCITIETRYSPLYQFYQVQLSASLSPRLFGHGWRASTFVRWSIQERIW